MSVQNDVLEIALGLIAMAEGQLLMAGDDLLMDPR